MRYLWLEYITEVHQPEPEQHCTRNAKTATECVHRFIDTAIFTPRSGPQSTHFFHKVRTRWLL